MGASCGGGVTISDSLAGLAALGLQELEPLPVAAGSGGGATVDTSDSVREVSFEVLR